MRELVAYVDAPVWVNDLTMRRAAILPEWNHLCEQHGLQLQANRLTFKLSSRTHASALAGGSAREERAERRATPVPLRQLTPDERSAIERAAAVITDPKLRQSAVDAMQAAFRWNKSQ